MSPRLLLPFKVHFKFPFLLVLWRSPGSPVKWGCPALGCCPALWYYNCQTGKAECPLQIGELVAQKVANKCHALKEPHVFRDLQGSE